MRASRVLIPASALALGLLALILLVAPPAWSVASHDAHSLSAMGVAAVTPPKPVPSITFTDAAGRKVPLADFRGRALVVNFWATWCVPCRKEMPSLDRLQAKLGGPRFQVIPVSIDRQGAAVVQPFYRELGLRSLGIFLDPSGKAPSILRIEGVPATLLIDTDGREIGRKLGALEWDRPVVIDTLRHVLGLTESKP